MKNESMGRVCYFSNSDLSIGANLDLAEVRVDEYEKCLPSELNGIIELWHIRKLFENVSAKPEYSEEFEKIKSKTSEYNSIVARYFKNMNPTDAVDEYKTLEWAYRNTFWAIIDQFKCYNAIDADALKSIVGANINELRCILKNCRLVEKYKQTIKELLLNSNLSAHLLLDEYVACLTNSDNEHLHFPSCLSISECEDIIKKYLESDDPNLNYVRLIAQAKNVAGKFVLSPKTRLKAERLARKLNDDLLHDPRTCITKRQFEIVFSGIEDKRMMSVSYEKGYPSYNYRKQFIASCSAKDKVIYCGRVFNWMDKHFMVNLINKNCEVSALESAFMDKSKTAYPNYQKFEDKNNLAIYQLAGYNNILLQLGLPIERLLENFYTKYCDAPDHPIYGENVSTEMNGYINAGYAVWREMVADIISMEAIIDICQLRISKKMIQDLYEQMAYGNPGAKAAAARMIAFVMLKNERDIAKKYPFFNKSTIRMLELVKQNLDAQPFFEITPDFIAKLGSAYLMALTEKMFGR